MSSELEHLVAKLAEKIEELKQQVETPLPAMLSLPRAALQLSVSRKQLARMIELGVVATLKYLDDGHAYVPSSEIRRLQGLAKGPDTPSMRRSGRRPKATRHNPRSELETLRGKLKKR